MDKKFERSKRLIISAFIVLVVIICAVVVVSAISRNSIYTPSGEGLNVNRVSNEDIENDNKADDADADGKIQEQNIKDSDGNDKDSKDSKDSKDKGNTDNTDSKDGKESDKESKESKGSKESDKDSKENNNIDNNDSENIDSKGSNDNNTYGQSSENPEDSISDVDSIAAPYIGRLESLESHYTAVVNNAAEAAKREFLSLPPDQQTEERKEAIVSSKSNQLSREEAQCDSQVSIILYELNSELVRSGLDNSIVNELRQRYYNEKASYSSQF